MPITIPEGLSEIKLLEKENIFVMPESRTKSQDIRTLKILILNLMPTKIETLEKSKNKGARNKSRAPYSC